ncbi:hypothetical protein AABB24_014211, partial [Solanum stoloniferum]
QYQNQNQLLHCSSSPTARAIPRRTQQLATRRQTSSPTREQQGQRPFCCSSTRFSPFLFRNGAKILEKNMSSLNGERFGSLNFELGLVSSEFSSFSLHFPKPNFPFYIFALYSL